MFGSKKKKKGGQKAVKFTGKNFTDDQLVAEGYRDNDMFPKRQRQPVNEMELPPPPSGAHPIDETEQILLELHTALVEFYARYKPENLDEDVLTILMQFSIDAGQEALNKKLKQKYGEDLNTFVPLDQAQEPPPPYMSTLERKHNKHRSLYDRTLPPPPKDDGKPKKKKPSSQEAVDNYEPHAPSGKPKTEYKNKLNRQESDILGLNGADPPPTISTQKLAVIDSPDFAVLDKPEQELEPRDLIEAFYFLHDESKLNSKDDDGIEKFVIWVEKNSLEELSQKLMLKYGQGLEDVKGVALRRRNLEDTIIAFYQEHDQAKLGTRYTIMKIVNWTMKHGLRKLNQKFEDRYGAAVVKLPEAAAEDIFEDL